MKANEYEVLLHRIYSKNSIEHSTEDVYAKMQMEYKKLNQEHSKNCIRRCEFEFKKSFFVVRNYVQQAIKDGLKHFRFNMVNEDVTKLNCMEAMLNRNFFDKRSLDQIIANANSVFSHYNS